MDDSGNDIRTACTSVTVEHYAQTDATHGSAYQACHEVLAGTQYQWRHSVGSVHQYLEEPQKESQHKDCISGFDAELRSENLDGKGHQDCINDEIRPLDRESGGVVDDGSDTCGTAGSDLIGDEERSPSHSVGN